jgi:hypothetical protein
LTTETRHARRLLLVGIHLCKRLAPREWWLSLSQSAAARAAKPL